MRNVLFDTLSQFEGGRLSVSSCFFIFSFFIFGVLVLFNIRKDVFYINMNSGRVLNVLFRGIIIRVFSKIYGLVLELLKNSGNYSLFPFVFSLGFFIVLFNLVGLLPYGFTITSSLAVTLFLSTVSFLLVVVLLVMSKKTDAILVILPEGLDPSLLIFLTFIEPISFFSRVVSLALRLFANMVAGHALIKTSISSCWILFSFLSIYSVLAVVLFILVFVIQLLEIAIAFLQAYVFCTLFCTYLQEVYTSH